eukprot:315658-Alexandrium_andersonii.AAC.1
MCIRDRPEGVHLRGERCAVQQGREAVELEVRGPRGRAGVLLLAAVDGPQPRNLPRAVGPGLGGGG